jgi:hypothetical protein
MNWRLMVPLAGFVLLLQPLPARAEVSVQLDRQGNVKRVVYLTGHSRKGAVIWSQVRARVPLEAMLNPLGDTYGDLAPTIATHPVTGNPWVVWPRNEGNQKRLMLSMWDGQRWTTPVRVATPDLMGYDQLEPKLVFDAAGAPYLVYAEKAPKGRVLFTTLARGAWTPPLLLSRPQEDSSEPATAMQGSDLMLAYQTPAGRVNLALDASRLVDGALSLMDSPIPPGAQPGPDDPGVPGGAGPGGRGGPAEPRKDDPILQMK